MRLWSLHPKYLDSRGLVALWREGLLAQKVLDGKTKGYRHHPQLARFRAQKEPLLALGAYLHYVDAEACRRGYCFSSGKIIHRRDTKGLIPVTRGQLDYERKHLLAKLKARDRKAYAALLAVRKVLPSPVFRAVPGGVEPWEKKRSAPGGI